MRNIIGFMLSITLTVMAINYMNVSNQTKESAMKSEVVIDNATRAFLDKVADSGAITAKDYTTLVSSLQSTGGTFNVNITVTRLYPIPDPHEEGNYYLDYRPAYGWLSTRGGFPNDYKDPNWQAEHGSPVPVGVQYLVKGDNVALQVNQVDAMDYQRSIVSRLGTGVNLGEWSLSKAVRDTGNAIVGNQQDPL